MMRTAHVRLTLYDYNSQAGGSGKRQTTGQKQGGAACAAPPGPASTWQFHGLPRANCEIQGPGPVEKVPSAAPEAAAHFFFAQPAAIA